MVSMTSPDGDGGSTTITRTWDLGGRPRTLVYPDTNTYQFTHDRAGRSSTSQLDSGPGTAWYHLASYKVTQNYGHSGRLSEETIATGTDPHTNEIRTYDEMFQELNYLGDVESHHGDVGRIPTTPSAILWSTRSP
jgi:hypothetical protein